MLKVICLTSITLYEVANALVILTFKNFITKEDAVRKFKSVISILKITSSKSHLPGR